MNATTFNDPAAAIDEAVFLASQCNKPHALVAVDTETIHVMPLAEATGLKLLEVCNP